MRSVLSILFAALAALTVSCTKTESLRIYCWANYLDTMVVNDFELAYYQNTGRRINVDYVPFESGGAAMSVLRRHEEKFDLICCAGHMVEALLREGVLRPFDKNRMPDPAIFVPWTMNFDYDPDNSFSLPFQYGTLGIMYDASKPGVRREDMKSWAALWDTSYRNQIMLKSSPFELYCMATLYVRREHLLEKADDYSYPRAYKYALVDAIYDFSDEMVGQVLAALNEQKALVNNYNAGSMRLAMEQGTGGKLGLFWSSEAVESMSVNRNLEFSIPLEGSYSYVDSWVLPQTVTNVEGAYAFLNFIYRTYNARRNMRTSKAPSAVAEANDEYRLRLMADTTFFAGATPEWKTMFVDAFFPSKQTLKRCWNQMPYLQYHRLVSRRMSTFVDGANKEAAERQKYLNEAQQY